MPLASFGQESSSLGLPDWSVLVGYLLLTSVLGAKLAGRQATIRDFFLGGRRLPWWAICGSIVATEISSATLIAVPVTAFVTGGNLGYLQLAIGAIIARVIVGYLFVPRYYEHEIYSPYDYMGRQMGQGVRKVTTGLFFVGAILGQGARLYITAFVLSAIAGIDLISAIWVMGLFGVAWTLMGGITTVIWTDVIQFGVLMLGAVCALFVATSAVPGGVSTVVEEARNAEKFTVFDLSTDLSLPYTLWCGLIATPFLNLAALGTDQVMAQRMFCCRSRTDARKAIIVSSLAILVPVLMLLVGVTLFVFFRASPFTPREQALYDANPTYLLPIFILRGVPPGLRGLIVAAVMASALSTLDSALAALAQTSYSAFIADRPASRRRRTSWIAKRFSDELLLSKALVVGWGVVLCAFASLCILIARQYQNAIDLALALVGYTYGPLLGIFMLAFLRAGIDHSGLVWAVPLTVLTVFGVSQHDLSVTLSAGFSVDFSNVIVWGAAIGFLGLGLRKLGGDLGRIAALAVGVVVMVLLHQMRVGVDQDGAAKYLAYTWTYPIGALMTFGLGYSMAKRR